MALDEATTALLEQLAANRTRPLHEMTPPEARDMMAAMRGAAPPGPEMASARDTRVKASGGYVPIRILTPNAHPRAVIVHYHGGGWVLGTIDDAEAVGRRLAQRSGCVVVLVDYRLAPEYRFPIAVDDAWAALEWAAAHVTELAGEPVPLIVAGDSAGGNLSAVVAQRAVAEGGPAIALQVLAYPVTNCDLDTTSYTDPANQLMLTRDSMIWFWDHYVPVPAARLHPDASPLRVRNLLGLPPAVILTAEHDVLRDDGELYATQLLKAGVPVLHQRFEGQMHGFFTMVDLLPGAVAAMDFVVAGIEKRLAGDFVSEGSAPTDPGRGGAARRSRLKTRGGATEPSTVAPPHSPAFQPPAHQPQR